MIALCQEETSCLEIHKALNSISNAIGVLHYLISFYLDAIIEMQADYVGLSLNSIVGFDNRKRVVGNPSALTRYRGVGRGGVGREGE